MATLTDTVVQGDLTVTGSISTNNGNPADRIKIGDSYYTISFDTTSKSIIYTKVS